MSVSRNLSLAALALLLPGIAEADEGAARAERSVDLASLFLNLSFEGIIATADRGDNCSYSIPTLTIRFTKMEGLATTAIKLDAFRVAAFASAEGKRKLFEQRLPLTAVLS